MKTLEYAQNREIRFPMNIAQKASTAAILVAVGLVLTGCVGGGPAEPSSSSASAKPSSSAEPQSADAAQEAFEAAAEGSVGVEVLEVIDPRTFLVGPDASAQERLDLAGEMTVSIPDSSELVTPAAGECGYDETVAFATTYFADNPDLADVIGGDFSSETYYEAAIRAGFAYIPNVTGRLVTAQQDAQTAQAGLWATCDGFGA